MTRIALLAVLAACQISDAHFIGPGVGDGGSDGSGGATANGYIIDESAPIIRHVTRNTTTGALALAENVQTMFDIPGTSAVMSKDGTHLYVFSGDINSQITTFLIGPNGALTQAGMITISGTCDRPDDAVLHPMGTWIVVSCAGGVIGIFPVQPGGSLGAGLNRQLGVGPYTFVFSPEGSCLYIADRGAAQTATTTAAGFFQGSISINRTTNGPVSSTDIAITPNGQFLYVVGGGTQTVIQPYSLQTACGITPLTMTAPAAATVELAMDPAGQYLFAFGGMQAFSFNVSTSGALNPVTGSPVTLSFANIRASIIDPALAAVVYVTSPTGVTPLRVNNGLFTELPSVAGAGLSRTFVLAP